MLIRLYWNQCTLARLESEPIDTFWVEATQQEAESLIFPYCSPDIIAKSQAFGKSDRAIAARFGNPSHSYCFLVAQDLSTINSFPVYYPHSPMWEAYSPFKKIAEHHINTLEELKTFVPSIGLESLPHFEMVKAQTENHVSLLV